MNLLEMNHVKKSFGGLEVIRDISLHVGEGEIVSIIGPSGSGKSTLLRCATMLETMDSGELIYLGERAAWNNEQEETVYAPKQELRKIRQNYGLVFQNYNLFPHFSVLKNITDAPVAVQKRDKKEAVKTAMELLKKMGFQIKMGSINQYIGAQIRIGIPRSGLGRLERQKIPPRRNVIQCKLFRSEYHTSRAQFLTPGSSNIGTILPIYPIGISRIQSRPIQ